MGICANVSSVPRDVLTKQEREQLEYKLIQERKEYQCIIKILFLGTVRSGKSTILKQLQYIHGDGYLNMDRRDIELMEYKAAIGHQIIADMLLAIHCIDILNDNGDLVEYQYIPLSEAAESAAFYLQIPSSIQSNKNNQNALLIHGYIRELDVSFIIPTVINALCFRFCFEVCISLEIAQLIEILWNEETIKLMYEERCTNNILDSSAYFWNDIYRIASDDYIPSEQDMQMVYRPTVGINQLKFELQHRIWQCVEISNVTNVYGYRPRKMLQQFDNFTTIIFVASLSCYDELCIDDETQNQMDDQIAYLREICTCWYFDTMPIILFLNKRDLFQEKFKEIPLSECFSFREYTTNDNMDHALDYMRHKFVDCNRSRDYENRRSIYTHFTCAVDNNNMNRVFNDVMQLLLPRSVYGYYTGGLL